MVDLDAETWTLWQANATTDTRLVSVGGDCAAKPKVNAAPPKISPPGGVNATNQTSIQDTTSSSESSAQVDGPSTSLNGGTIAGIAVGAVVGCGLLVGAFVLCRCRRKRRTQPRRSGSEADIALTKYTDGHGRESGGIVVPMYHEKSADSSAHELSSSWIPAHELPVWERPTEVSGGHWSVRPVELPGTLKPKTWSGG